MAQSIRNLSVGSKVIDAKGNKFIIIAYNHYALNEVTLLIKYKFITTIAKSQKKVLIGAP